MRNELSMIDIENPGGIAGLGRGEDTMLAHVAPGEMVVPPVLSPETQETIKQEMIAVGLDPNQYTVGGGMSINPITGVAEFGFLKKLGKSLKKVVKKVAPVAMLIPGVGTAIGGALGGLGSAVGLGGKLPRLTSFFQTVASKNIPGVSPFLSGLTAGATGSTFATASNPFGQAIRTGLTNPFGGAFSSATGGVNPLTGATGGLTSTFTKAFGGGTNTGGGGVSLPLLALAGLYGKAVKEDFEGKQGGLKDIRQSIRPDLMPAPTFTGFDLGIRPGMADGGVITDPNNLPADLKIKLENIYRKLYLANPEKDRNRRRADYSQLTEDERELHKQYLTGKLRRDAPLVAKYMDLIGFDNIGDDNPLLAGAKFASTALSLSGALPTSRIRRRLNPDAGILSDPIKDKVLAERKEIYGYAEGGFMDEQELDLRMGGPSIGPGTGTSDDIPAMLSDGEFVMTSSANNGLGGFKITKTETGIELIPNGAPDRQKGAKNMDKLMKTFEKFNEIGKV